MRLSKNCFANCPEVGNDGAVQYRRKKWHNFVFQMQKKEKKRKTVVLSNLEQHMASLVSWWQQLLVAWQADECSS
jgi:hypothetical protein